MHTVLQDHRDDVPFAAIWPFLLITFGLTWGILFLFIVFPDAAAAAFGPLTGSHPLFVLAVYTPAIAAFVLVALHGGLPGLRRYLSRMLLWRCSLAWYLFLILGIPLIFFAGSAVKGNLFTDPLPFSGIGGALGAMAFMLVLGPVEEFGWRGVALPLLQRRLAPLWAGLVLGSIWGLWHLPAFFLSGTPQGAWGFTPFLLGSIAVSVILTPLFNRSQGSILLAALFHFQLINPLWPDAQPYDTVFFIAAALVIVWLNRRSLLRPGSGVGAVIPRHA